MSRGVPDDLRPETRHAAAIASGVKHGGMPPDTERQHGTSTQIPVAYERQRGNLMHLATIKKIFWPFGLRLPDQAVLQDAGDLIQIWGEAAYSVAANMSWREDMGLIYAAEVGHWARVKREIGFRQGWNDDEPEADFAASLDRLWHCA